MILSIFNYLYSLNNKNNNNKIDNNLFNTYISLHLNLIYSINRFYNIIFLLFFKDMKTIIGEYIFYLYYTFDYLIK
jgi:hypothetical protein